MSAPVFFTSEVNLDVQPEGAYGTAEQFRLSVLEAIDNLRNTVENATEILATDMGDYVRFFFGSQRVNIWGADLNTSEDFED